MTNGFFSIMDFSSRDIDGGRAAPSPASNIVPIFTVLRNRKHAPFFRCTSPLFYIKLLESGESAEILKVSGA